MASDFYTTAQKQIHSSNIPNLKLCIQIYLGSQSTPSDVTEKELHALLIAAVQSGKFDILMLILEAGEKLKIDIKPRQAGPFYQVCAALLRLSRVKQSTLTENELVAHMQELSEMLLMFEHLVETQAYYCFTSTMKIVADHKLLENLMVSTIEGNSLSEEAFSKLLTALIDTQAPGAIPVARRILEHCPALGLVKIDKDNASSAIMEAAESLQWEMVLLLLEFEIKTKRFLRLEQLFNSDKTLLHLMIEHRHTCSEDDRDAILQCLAYIKRFSSERIYFNVTQSSLTPSQIVSEVLEEIGEVNLESDPIIQAIHASIKWRHEKKVGRLRSYTKLNDVWFREHEERPDHQTERKVFFDAAKTWTVRYARSDKAIEEEGPFEIPDCHDQPKKSSLRKRAPD